jgi:hypothetical protein
VKKSARQYQALLATVRPRDPADRTRRRIAAEELEDLHRLDAKLQGDESRAQSRGRSARPIAVGCGYQGSSFQCPSETTSTVPSVTLMAVWSSMAYAGPAMLAAHLSAWARVLPGMSW